eukprot:TRINITY_DN7965_c0_g2_i1.p1 TRINITY_DN7965_c0_g2~~TRINITY_DN7965_c0_g2_i1.p1  ORF type:complete len:230 (+),score=78.18 TRINITY_DN7965_c0_g2_i1:31-720(+)
MRFSYICVVALLGLAGVLSIETGDQPALLETSAQRQGMEVDMSVNSDVLAAQQSIMGDVANSSLVTDGDVDAAVKSAFEPIFSRCENIIDPKHQRRCLLRVAAGKDFTRKGARAARLRKLRAQKRAAKEAKKEAKAVKVAAKSNKTVVVKKDKLASHADKIKKHIAAAKKHEAAMKKEQAAIKSLEAKVKADLAKQAAKAKKVVAKAAAAKNETAKVATKNETAKKAFF